MVDRDKDAGIDESRMAAERNTAGREQSITRKDEITEESRLAHKQSVVLQGPGKVCLFQFCVCACERGACRSERCQQVGLRAFALASTSSEPLAGKGCAVSSRNPTLYGPLMHDSRAARIHLSCVWDVQLEDTDYDELDLRPSELAIKIKEKRGAYAVPKDQGQV